MAIKSNRVTGLTLFLPFLLSLFFSCQDRPIAPAIKVVETKGLARNLDYVTVEIPMSGLPSKYTSLVAENSKGEESHSVQILDMLSREGDSFVKIMFPVIMAANETQRFSLRPSRKSEIPEGPKEVEPEHILSFENEIYKAVLHTGNDQRGGQVHGVYLKKFNDVLLKRGHLTMHWAPNFSPGNTDSYFNFEDLPKEAINTSKTGLYQNMKYRSGVLDSVPEIHLKGAYAFYDGLPYFIFESTMQVTDTVELDLLRNDEMTMDSLFTHVVYQAKNGSPQHRELYAGDVQLFKERIIPDDADFVGFYHEEKGYGLASIRLAYDNTDQNGKPSHTYRPYTKISTSKNNGRYWNRVLADTLQEFPAGSRYYEKNAYLIFETDRDVPEREILYVMERLRNPLEVYVE